MAESEPNPDNRPRACGPSDADPFDDMHDNQADWEQYASLLPLRGCCQIGDAFDAADKEAVKYQKRHRRLTCVAAFVATIAVVAAIVGLGYSAASDLERRLHSRQEPTELAWERTLEEWELGAALVTVLLVGAGFSLKFKENWLRYRHRAELFRLLRYNFLIQPSLWGSKDEDPWIAERVREIERLTAEGSLEKALNEPSPRGPCEPIGSRMGRHRLQALTQYYLAKRLGPQKEYLANRAQHNEIKDWMRLFLPFFFFGSILAVLVKFLLKEPRPWWGFALTLAAALLPVFAAGIRTYLAAFEFSRNKSRFYAAHKALSETEKSLVQNTFGAVTAEPRPPGRQESFLVESHLGQVIVVAEQSAADAKSDMDETDSYPVLRDLAWCEHVLDAEHREWLRLMYDAEWFG